MNRILEVCKEKGVTQIELAERLNIARQSLHSVITGDARFSSYQKIADALGVHITDLFEREPENTITCPKCGAKLEIKEKTAK